MSVYFIRVGRYFKIGASDNPQRRFERLHQGGTRYTFPVDASLAVADRELYKVVDGHKDREFHIHQALDNFAVGLEWFLDEPPLRAFIDSLPVPAPRRPLPTLAEVERVGGWCEEEYRRIQHERAVRETARYMAARSA